MRTGYKRETWEFGSSREVEEKHTGNYGARGQKREKKRKPTKEEITKQNQWKRERDVRRLIKWNLKRMTKPSMITFFTDCHYFANGQRQLASWRENGWKRSDGKELRNLDLWQQLEELLRPHAVSFQMENMELYKSPDETPWS